MIAFIDFFSIYIVDAAETLIAFHFFVKFMDKQARIYHYLLFILISNIAVIFLHASTFTNFALRTLLLLLYALFVLKGSRNAAILYAVITVAIMQLCYGISKSFTGMLSPALYALSPDAVSLFFMIASSFMALLLSYICYCIVQKYFTCSETGQSQYALMIFMPSLMIFMLSEYINHIIYSNTIILSESGVLLNANHFELFVIQIFGICSLFSVLYAYKKLIVSFWLTTKLSMLEQETNYQNQYVTEAKSRYEKTKSFRHDMKNHFSVLRGLLENGNIQKAKNYLQSMEIVTNDLSFPCHTNNPVLDILIGNKFGLAKNNGINVSCSLEVPYPCSIMDVDFCIILSNALDNAICACEKMEELSEKWIQVLGHRQGDFFVIEIKNSCNTEQSYKKGIGLSNIKSITEKYNGAMSTNRLDGMFCLSVLLIIPQQSEGISQQSY